MLADLIIERSTVSASLARQIRQLIVEHKLRTGDRIPSQRELAAQLAVGVPAIGEALENLEAIGLLEIRHGKRTLVKRVDVDSLLESVSPAIQLTEAEVVHLLEFKEIIETRCAYLAAKRASAEDIEKMEKYLRMMEKHKTNDQQFAEADYFYHYTIVQAAHNPIMNRVMKIIGKMLEKAIEKAASLHEWRNRALDLHGRIYAAIRKKDSKAASSAVEKLIEETLKRYKSIERK